MASASSASSTSTTSSTSLGSWETIKIVGKGGSSTVYRARLTATGQLIAVKQINIEGLNKDQIQNIKGEIDTMSNLSHEHIIQYLGTQQSANKINIFLEYADRGSLRQYYQKRGSLKQQQLVNCTRQILLGLKYLHDNGIAHRDIKCANCLLTKKGHVKLADFGASKKFESESLVSGLKGTPNWMSPEVIRGSQMTTGWQKADVWSLGCTVVEMATGKLPFSEYDNPMTAMYHIANGKAPSLHGVECSEDLKGFIALCCAADPLFRPTVDSLLQHPFVTRDSSLTAPVIAAEGNEFSQIQASTTNSNLTVTGVAMAIVHESITPAHREKLSPSPVTDTFSNRSKAITDTDGGSPLISMLRGRADSTDIFTEKDYQDEIFDEYEDDFEPADTAAVYTNSSIIDETAERYLSNISTGGISGNKGASTLVVGRPQISGNHLQDDTNEAEIVEEMGATADVLSNGGGHSKHSIDRKDTPNISSMGKKAATSNLTVSQLMPSSSGNDRAIIVPTATANVSGAAGLSSTNVAPVKLSMMLPTHDDLTTPVMSHGKKFFAEPANTVNVPISITAHSKQQPSPYESPDTSMIPKTTPITSTKFDIKPLVRASGSKIPMARKTLVSGASAIGVAAKLHQSLDVTVSNAIAMPVNALCTPSEPFARPAPAAIYPDNDGDVEVANGGSSLDTSFMSDQGDTVASAAIPVSDFDECGGVSGSVVYRKSMVADEDNDDGSYEEYEDVEDVDGVEVNGSPEGLIQNSNLIPPSAVTVDISDTNPNLREHEHHGKSIYRPCAPMSGEKLRFQSDPQPGKKAYATASGPAAIRKMAIKEITEDAASTKQHQRQAKAHGSAAQNIKKGGHIKNYDGVSSGVSAMIRSKSKSFVDQGLNSLQTVYEKTSSSKTNNSSSDGMGLKRSVKLHKKVSKVRSKSAGLQNFGGNDENELKLPPVTSKTQLIPAVRTVYSAPAASRSVNLPPLHNSTQSTHNSLEAANVSTAEQQRSMVPSP